MLFVVKVVVSAVIIAIVSTVARRQPAFGALIASLPIVSILGMIWLWVETHDRAGMQAHVGATFWYVIPSLPMFLAIPAMMRAGLSFWAALAIGCALTFGLYLATVALLGRLGVRL